VITDLNVTDGRTDRRHAISFITALCVASRGKKQSGHFAHLIYTVDFSDHAGVVPAKEIRCRILQFAMRHGVR